MKVNRPFGIAVAMAAVAVAFGIAFTIINPGLVAGQSSPSARAYITAEIGSGDDTVSWSDPGRCTSDYNLYLYIGRDQTRTRKHLGSVASGSTQATLPVTHSIPNPFDHPSVELQLYCGEYDSSSPRSGRLASTSLSMRSSSTLRHGTFSSAPLTALSVSSATLSPSFNRGIYRYTTSVPSDSRTITLNATGLTGYQFEYVKNPGWGTLMACGSTCVYSFGGTKLTDSDVYTPGFQVELDRGESRLAVALHKGDEGAGAKLYVLTVTVANVAATGEPTISGTAQVGQTLTASTADISDEDGLRDADFSYQWLRVGSDSTESDISDATGSTYTLSTDDAGNSIKVKVTFTDDAGNEEALTSAATATVTTVSAASADATLSALTLSGVSFGPFAPATTSYTASVNNTVTQTTVTPTVNDSEASHVIKLGGTTDADGTVSLAVGSNVITVEVTAEDGQTTKTYTITVTRLDAQADPISSDADLSGLTLSGIDIGTFASGTTSYIASAANSVSQTTVTPTTNHSGASYVIKLGGVTDADGVLPLRVGSNVIAVEVTAEDTTTTKTYTVTVTRADPFSTDATLKLLVLDGIEFRIGPLTGDTTYGRSISYSHTEATITATTNHEAASYVVKDDGVVVDDGVVSLALGSNSFTVVVTAEDGTTTKTYNVFLFRMAPSDDATLSGLTLSGVSIGTFASDTRSYTVSVANSVSQTTVTPTLNDEDASYVIKLGAVEDQDGTVSLAVGSNVITVEVTAEDGRTTKTYTVTVTRAAPPNSPATGTPTITGTAQVGETLTASTSGISDADGLTNVSYIYQWLADDTAITGATASTYTLTSGEQAKAIKVRVSFRRRRATPSL